MIFADDTAVINYVKKNQKTPDWVTRARKYSSELCALVNGENFIDELISKIEHIESQAKAQARIKYARNIKGFYTRLLLPIQNVFAATGGVKNYQNGTKLSDENQKKLLSILSNVRDGKSLERYIETQWMNLYHTDPSGVLWMRYTTDLSGKLLSCYPTYQSIGAIRTYIPKGQLVECILYEPYTIDTKKYWVVVDDAKQYTVIESGDILTISEDPLQTFPHPFGTAPVIINSGIIDKNGNRLSPIDDVVPVSKEYARDQSIKTIYKFLHGFPKSWVMDMMCATCNGQKHSIDKDGTKSSCKDCSGTGWRSGKLDVADVAKLPFPKDNTDPIVKGADIMGFSSPDLDTWVQQTAELEFLECEAYETMWGTEPEAEVQKTATEVYQDQQPKINKLNKYADACEWLEWTMTEWIANAIDTAKAKDKNISLIVYGRRYILEGVDTIQKKYEDAKAAGENTVVLDSIFDELLTVKFKNDPEWMKQELKKAQCEPFLHYSPTEIFTWFGASEAARKVYFQRWWKNLTDQELQQDVIKLQSKFDADFKTYLDTLLLEPKAAPVDPVKPINQ